MKAVTYIPNIQSNDQNDWLYLLMIEIEIYNWKKDMEANWNLVTYIDLTCNQNWNEIYPNN